MDSGVIPVVLGVVFLMVAALVCVPAVMQWLVDSYDNDYEKRGRRTRLVQSWPAYFDWHHRTGKKLAPVILPLFFLLLGLTFLGTGLADLL